MMYGTRRDFLRGAASAGAAFAFPAIVPARVFGASAPSNTINVAQIGCGRIGLTMDVPGFLRASGARVAAVCDLDSRRLAFMRSFVAKRQGGKSARISTPSRYRRPTTGTPRSRSRPRSPARTSTCRSPPR